MIKNKKNGSSLIYILIILSVISLVSYGFFIYVFNKYEISKLDKNGYDKNILAKRLIKKEKRQIEILNNTGQGYVEYLKKEMKKHGYDLNNIPTYNKNIGAYYNLCIKQVEKIITIPSDDDYDDDYDNLIWIDDDEPIENIEEKLVTLEYEHLIYSNEDKSIGGFKILNVNSKGRELNLPLIKGKNYGVLNIRYIKTILGISIIVEEKMEFIYKNNEYIPNTIEYKFINEDNIND